jgi:hypothetical protein
VVAVYVQLVDPAAEYKVDGQDMHMADDDCPIDMP